MKVAIPPANDWVYVLVPLAKLLPLIVKEVGEGVAAKADNAIVANAAAATTRVTRLDLMAALPGYLNIWEGSPPPPVYQIVSKCFASPIVRMD